MPKPPTHQLMWLCASYEKVCPGCKGTGNVPERAYPPGAAVTTCFRCAGTGRIPLKEAIDA